MNEIKWTPNTLSVSSPAKRDKHYVFFHGRWRRVPHFMQCLCDRYGARIFGTMATSTIYRDGFWTGSVR